MYTNTVGSKAQVYHGTALHTSGGLTKKNLVKSKGRIKSKKQVAHGKKAIKNLRKLGFVAKKGTFRLFKKSDRKKKGGKTQKKR
jgi:hypothetical protein